MRAETLERVNRAVQLVTSDRNESYGDPLDNMSRTASLFAAYLGYPVSPKDVAILMCLVKIAREAYMPKADNLDDLLGWGMVAIECQE